MLLVDAGCEVSCYASDVTRTYPVNGKFGHEDGIIYQIVLDSQEAVLRAMKPGVEWEDMHRLAEKVILNGLISAGIVHGEYQELMKHHVAALFFPHGLGHLIGLDVHDVGGYPPGVERIQEPGIRYLRMRRTLKENMVVTVEPGLYFIDQLLDQALQDHILSKFINASVLDKFRHIGGVRIEDDVLITSAGIEILTAAIPKQIQEIQDLMSL
jgi:Xaa-Pro dipeptidase